LLRPTESTVILLT